MIKAVIFDLGGVLIDNPTPIFIKSCCDNLDVSKDKFMVSYRKFKDGFQRGITSEDEFWDKLCSDLGVGTPSIGSLWTDSFKKSYKEKPEMFELMNFLNQKDYKVALLSNTEVPVVKLVGEKLNPLFDVIIYSCLEGLRKPEREIYELVLNKLGVAASEAVFIDDKERNIQCAEKLSIRSILFKDPDQVKQELVSLGILEK